MNTENLKLKTEKLCGCGRGGDPSTRLRLAQDDNVGATEVKRLDISEE
jgi:hypothetical protein